MSELFRAIRLEVVNDEIEIISNDNELLDIRPAFKKERGWQHATAIVPLLEESEGDLG